MKYYIEAFDRLGHQILGNMDGQAVLRCRWYHRTKHFKALSNGLNRPKWKRVSFWTVVNEDGHQLSHINNPHSDEVIYETQPCPGP